MSRHLLYMMLNERRLWIQWRGNVLHLELICGTPINFEFLRWHQCSSCLETVVLGTFRVQSSKSRLRMCLIGKMQLVCMQCRGIWPHLVARGNSHGFSRVAAGTCGIFSSYDRDAHSFFFFFLFVVNFVINWNKTAMGLHVFPIPIPTPTSLSTRYP